MLREIRRYPILAPEFEPSELQDLVPRLKGYDCSPLTSRIRQDYSKLTTVRKLHEAVEENAPSNRLNKRAADVFAALYTDRRILFAQTREYAFPESMYSSLAYADTDEDLRKAYEANYNLEPVAPASYTPKISIAQCKILDEQIRRAKAFNWRNRRGMISYLRRFLHPTEGEEGTRFAKKPVVRDPYTVDLSGIISQLHSAFREHWKTMYGDERSGAGFKGWSSYFVHSFQNDETLQPYFLDRPDVIFHLFRDYRASVIRSGEKPYSVRTRLMESLDVPITQATLKADMLLFQRIVKACKSGCEILRIHFDSDQWLLLWLFLQRGIDCLSFEPYDLLTYGGAFSKLLWYPRLREPFDLWIRDKMFGNGTPFFFDMFRTATNEIGPPISTPAASYHKIAPDPKTYSEFISSYQDLLLNPAKSQNAMSKWKLLGQFSQSVGWNYIKIVPTEEELTGYVPIRNAADNLARLLEILEYSDSYFEYRYPRSWLTTFPKQEQKSPIIKTRWLDLRNLLFEWFLLQSLCFLRWRDLMETALILMERNKKEPM